MTVIPFPKREAVGSPSRSAAPVASTPAGAAFLHERDLVTDDLTVNEDMVRQIGLFRADREYHAYKQQGLIPDWSKIVRAERDRARELAETMIAVRRGQREYQFKSRRDRLLGTLRLELEKAELGLAIPYQADEVRRLKSLIAEVEATPENDIGLLLATKLLEQRA